MSVKSLSPQYEVLELNSLVELLHQSVSLFPDNNAFTSKALSQDISYSDLMLASASLHTLLQRYDVNEGEKVLFFTKNSPIFFPLLFACASRRCVLVPVNPESTQSEIKNILNDSKAKLILRVAEAIPQMPTHKLNEVDVSGVFEEDHVFSTELPYPSTLDSRDSPVLLIYTSGSTSLPKGVLLTQRNLFHMAESLSTFYEINSEDKVLCVLPFYHINAPMITGLSCLKVGAHVVIADIFSFQNALSYWELVSEYGVSILSITPSIAAALLSLGSRDKSLNLKRLRFAMVGTARFDPVLWRDFEKTFQIPCYQGYGLTETTTWATMTPKDDRKRYDTAGIPVNCEIKIDQSAIPSVPGENSKIGEILIGGDLVMKGYHNQKKLNKASLVDSFFRTGDLGYLDHDGQLVITGRLKNIIKRNGILIFPDEIDAFLISLSFVKEVKTIGIGDHFSGEKVMCCVVFKDEENAYLEETIRQLRLEFSSQKVPDSYYVMKSLPRNPIGKIDQKALLERLDGTLCEKLVSKFDRYEYRRAHSESLDQVKSLIQKALLKQEKLYFAGFWGVGSRSELKECDFLALNRLDKLICELNEMCGESLFGVKLILADEHARCNRVPDDIAKSYLLKIKNEAIHMGMECLYLSEIWKKYSLSLTEIKLSAEQEKDFIDLKEDLLRQAKKRSFITEDPEVAALRYFTLCCTEKKVIGEFLKGNVFFTYSSPHFKKILPEMPTLYFHSIKPGVAERPWFI
ncbi:MAG: class I adenylate-forming enzyme family protein [Bdellovibrionota bacterium]